MFKSTILKVFTTKDGDFHGRTVSFREGKAGSDFGAQTDDTESRSQGDWFAELDSLTDNLEFWFSKDWTFFFEKEFMLNHQ